MTSVIFMGTPDFAVPSLTALVENSYDVKLVVCQPDRPAGRGQKLQSPAVKIYAESQGIDVIQPNVLRSDPEGTERILSTECDFLVVAAFGQILPRNILEHPRFAPLNVHASLLPAYRGAAPIARAIIEGEKKTGVTIQWMTEALDMGDILYQIPCEIREDETSFDLHERLQSIGAQALMECLARFKNGRIERDPQNPRIGSYAKKLTKEESKISFDAPAHSVHRKIMGLNPWPVAECQLAGQRLRIFKSRFEARPADADPGTLVDITDKELVVACEDACVSLLEVQMENRKRLPVSEFLKSQNLPRGLILGGASA